MGAARELFEATNAELFLAFKKTQPNKRVLNKVKH